MTRKFNSRTSFCDADLLVQLCLTDGEPIPLQVAKAGLHYEKVSHSLIIEAWILDAKELFEKLQYNKNTTPPWEVSGYKAWLYLSIEKPAPDQLLRKLQNETWMWIWIGYSYDHAYLMVLEKAEPNKDRFHRIGIVLVHVPGGVAPKSSFPRSMALERRKCMLV